MILNNLVNNQFLKWHLSNTFDIFIVSYKINYSKLEVSYLKYSIWDSSAQKINEPERIVEFLVKLENKNKLWLYMAAKKNIFMLLKHEKKIVCWVFNVLVINSA